MSKLMQIALPQGEARFVGFETPLEMLKACHRRVEDQCATLRRLSVHLRTAGSDRQAQEAATAVMRYFELAAPKHHADEEQDLFPALLESMAGSDAVCLRDMIDALRMQHTELDQRWQALREVLREVASGRPAQLGGDAVGAFEEHYAAHIAREETELLPMAERLLSEQTLEAMGRSMRARRGEEPAKV